MSGNILFPPAAALEATRVDHLFYFLIGVSLLVVGGVGVLLIVFAVRYRRGHHVNRKWRRSHRGAIEYTWTIAPFLIFLTFFAWGAKLYVDLHSPERDALTIYGVGKQWMWKFEHPGGQREIDELHVPSGRPVRILLASQDVIHSFFVPAFRTKQDAVPGYLTSTWFTATQRGDFHLFCAEFCGTQHSAMIGRVIVMAPEDYAAWLERERPVESLASRGRALFRELGCSQCHQSGKTDLAPPLEGLFGREAALSDGRRIVADENYLSDSILYPDRQIVAGYEPRMPSFAGQIDATQLFALLAYIEVLGHVSEQP